MALTRETPSHKRRNAATIVSAPLVGRRSLLDALLSPTPPLTIIVGEMGAGKTRLLAEARTANERRKTYSVVCQRGASLLPLDPLVTLVRVLHRDGLVPTALKDAVAGASERDRLSYIREALERAARLPLTCQLDDLHWADRDTPDALRYCVDRLQDAPIKWHVTSRLGFAAIDEFGFSAARAGIGEVLNVEGLTLDELRAFAGSLTGDHAPDDDRLVRLFERTGGNPLYAELLLTTGSTDSEIPKTLKWALHDRLSALSAVAADVAAWIAVHRGPLQQGAIAALSRYSPAQILTALTELVDKGIVRKTVDGYAFRHELLRDVCYEAIEEPVRAARHQQLAERTEDDWQRAGHFDGAKRYEEAAAILTRIGWDRLDRDSPSEALAAFERALERVNPDSEPAWEARAGFAAATFAAGKPVEAGRLIHDFEARAPGLSVPLRVSARCLIADTIWKHAQDAALAAPLLDAAIDEAVRTASTHLPRLYCTFGAMLERQGRLREAQDALEKGIEACDDRAHGREAILLRAWLGVVMGRLGAAREGIALLEEAADRAAATGMSNELARCCNMLCYVSEMIDDSERYEYWCRRGLEVAGPKSRRIQALLMNNLACVASDAGRLQEALGLNIAAVAAIESGSTIATQALCGQANQYAMLGDFESAQRVIGEARRHKLAPSWRRAVDFTAGYVQELSERYDDALASFDRAVGSEREIDEVVDLRALAGIVRSASGAGNRERARAALERLRGVNQLGWPVARQLVKEAEAYWKLLSGDRERGCAELLEVASQTADRYWQAHLRTVVADARGDRDLFNEAIDVFDALGASAAGDRARALARAHGLRPGRKREGRGNLSEREISVALLVASGKTNAEIGDLLHVSPRTVEYHLGNVMSKCGLRSRVEIAIRVAAGTLLGSGEGSTTA